MPKTSSDIRLRLKFTHEQRELIERAAALKAQSPIAFVVEAARQAADRTIAKADAASAP
ncbi:MAG: DUF1778 domain-containing protein [Ignavibacteriales bacterium]